MACSIFYEYIEQLAIHGVCGENRDVLQYVAGVCLF